MGKYLFIAANEHVPWGGSEVLWSQAAKRLVKRGFRVCVSVKDWGAPVKQVEDLRSAGCEIFRRRPPSLLNRLRRKVIPRDSNAAEHLRKVVGDADLVVISQGSAFDGAGWMAAAKSMGQKYVAIVQTAGESIWPTDDDFAETLAECYESASAAYFVSQANLELTRRQFVTPLRRGAVVRNPFNVRYDAQPPWPGEAREGLALACVGRLEAAQKGQDLLFQVLSLPHWRERSLRVTVVGSGMNERRLRMLADSLRLNSVEFAGFRDDIEDVWRKHHALVLPSRYEGFPLALVEAMLCGRPCIVTDVGGNRELVRDGINGFLAKAPTVELLNEAMNRAWECRGRLREMGEQAACDVRKFVPADPAEDFVRELESLVDGAGSK